jgi:serine/threonine-protein kinase RsbW
LDGQSLNGKISVTKVLSDETFPSSFDAMTGPLDRSMDVLRKGNWFPGHCASSIRLCVEEALVNAVRHGNQENDERKIRLTITEQGEVCMIKVYDEGAGFSPESVLLASPDQFGGRGVCIIRHFMEKVVYNEPEHCLEMTFSRMSDSKGES